MELFVGSLILWDELLLTVGKTGLGIDFLYLSVVSFLFTELDPFLQFSSDMLTWVLIGSFLHIRGERLEEV